MPGPSELDPDWVRRTIEASDAGRVLGPAWQLVGVRSGREGRGVWEVKAAHGHFIARVATGEGDSDRLRREQRLAEFMDFLPVQVPPITVHDAPGGVAISLRPKIEGEEAGGEMFENRFSDRDRQVFVRDVAELLHRMHATPLEVACRGLGIPILGQQAAAVEVGCARWFDAERIEAATAASRSSNPRLEVLWKEIRSWLGRYRVDPDDMVFGHGDLHGGNMIVAPTGDGFRLVGIFDLENGGIVNLYDEFLRIYLMDVELGQRIVETYNQLPGLARTVAAPVIGHFYRAFLFFLLHQSTNEAYSSHCVRMLEAYRPQA